MKKLFYSILGIFFLAVVMIACKEDEAELGAPPKEEDAVFNYTPTAESNNILQFSNTAPGRKSWDFGNGQTGEGNVQTATYPNQGTYEVTLTVYASGGSISSKQTIEIEETDLSLLDPVYGLIAGGDDYPDGKTWVIDAGRAGHLGVGPVDEVSPIWWAAPANDKSGTGFYDDEHVFKLNGSAFIQKTNGDVYLNGGQAANFPGAYENKGDFTAPFTAPDNLTWSIVSDGDGTYTLQIKGGGFIGYYAGTATYKVLSISENEMFLRAADAAVPANAWFMRLIPLGFEPELPPPPPPPATSTMPINFEGAKPPFNGFGETIYDVVDNPDASGINTSAKVALYEKGMEGNWAGIETALSAKLDFSTNTLIKYKVYSPVTGRALFKLESIDGATPPVEIFANITKVNEWEELTFNFSEAPSNAFDKIAMFLDFDNNNGGTFYVDDIRQTFEPAVLTLADLSGGSSKTWKLKPAAGAFGVGPSKGSDEWYPNGQNISGDRPCLFNDEYIFKTGDVYEYDSKGDVWGETYMGVPSDGCIDETDLPANAQVWASGTHTFAFTPAADGNPATITVTGTGAFIALPKGYNNGEYGAPPATSSSVTYEVLSYIKTATTETLNITVDVAAGGGTFWNFTLISE